jgi:hypothetical protein
MEPFQNSEVEGVYRAYSDRLREKLMRLRHLIFETAAELEDVGPLEETLKWGQPSYLTKQSKSGTTIRVDQIKSKPRQYCMMVHCQTSLVATYREFYSEVLRFDGKRCIEFDVEMDPPEDALRHCIELALTYHRNKRRDRLPF